MINTICSSQSGEEKRTGESKNRDPLEVFEEVGPGNGG